ncbi:MAG: L-alanine-DL-glutamate epimerase-like enolase superfamily enzyme [Pirellulaceae bacterium]|jgi:L-alanine-DL-glutamate epimerase-like enolase superfamily enzyme
MNINRRTLLKSALATTTALALPFTRQALRAEAADASEKHYEIVDIKRTTVKLEYREVPRRHMDRELPHWRYTELCDVTLKNGKVGTGETLLYYTWEVPSDEDVRRVIGKSAIEVMWDDSLGAGLQMALFDAVARTANVPIRALLGNQVYKKTPLSWWNIDTSAKDMASECLTAYKLGYSSYKTKGRPWFDVDHQMELACKAIPAEFKIDMDFNSTLRDAERGIPILKRVAKYPQTDIFESPIPQSDVDGNKEICAATHVNIAMHYGTPTPATVVQSGCCDGFVVGHGATDLMAAGRFCTETQMPFWLQLVGSGITAAYSLHFGGVLDQATWPAVNCHQLYENDLLVRPIELKHGFAAVPDLPGIGHEIDRDMVERLKVKRPPQRPEPKRLIETTWTDGKRMFTASNGRVNFMLTAGNQERYPYYAPGADTRLVKDDGSARWKALYEKARKLGPIEG